MRHVNVTVPADLLDLARTHGIGLSETLVASLRTKLRRMGVEPPPPPPPPQRGPRPRK